MGLIKSFYNLFPRPISQRELDLRNKGLVRQIVSRYLRDDEDFQCGWDSRIKQGRYFTKVDVDKLRQEVLDYRF